MNLFLINEHYFKIYGSELVPIPEAISTVGRRYNVGRTVYELLER